MPGPRRLSAQLLLFAAFGLCPAGTLYAADKPPWLIAIDAVTRLPDPFDTRELAGIDGGPQFAEPRCVIDASLSAPNRKCWAQTTHGSVFLQATLEYYSDANGSAASKIGTLNVVLPRQSCTTIGQAESLFQKKIHAKLGPEPRSNVSARSAYYQIRVFGANMHPLTLDFITFDGCITAATLSR